ncbi:MAG: hypothetical protein WCH52_06340 [Bacteroidota bacterium]
MTKTPHLILNPTLICQDDLLTVKNAEGTFQNTGYVIKNESGSIIRKGSISNNLFGFQMRIIGLKVGFYQFIMGDQQEVFQVVQ